MHWGEFMRVPSQPRNVPATGTPCCSRGFTVVELMITIAVAAILLMIAVPSFNKIVNTNRLNAAANAMIGALNTARMAAIQQNTSAQFCSNAASTNTTGTSDTLGNACGTSTGEVFVLSPPGGTTFTQLAAAPSELGIPTIQIHGTVAAIRYNSQGLGYAPGSTTPYDSSSSGPVVDICSTALSTNNHIQINMAAGGIISTTTVPGSTTDTCP
jgi:type IV fimbrial biogenesis protein FimT